MDAKKLRLLQLIVVICVVLPGPFVFLGMLKEAQFTFGFTIITIFNLQRETVLDAIKEQIKSYELRMNLWIALMFCQVAFTVNASISLYQSARPGILMCLGAVLVSHILIGLKKQSMAY